jgi:hypothetical protein
MRTSRRKKARPSKDQVRAWLTTVIAPLASALAVEQHRLTSGNWSFRCDTQDFEFLWPIKKMVAAVHEPNLQQLLRYRPELKKLAHDHERTLDGLRTTARGAYDRLRHDQRFLALVSSTSVSEHDGRYFAEYAVNGLRDLASYYTFQELWTREGAKFLALREDPTLGSEFTALEAAGQELSKSVNSLLRAVRALQEELADSYKLPPVDPTDAVRV